MRIKTIKRVIVLFLVNHCLAGTRCFNQKRYLLRSIGYDIGRGTKVVGPIFCTGKLVIGEECWIGRNFKVNGNGNVTIGSHCDIAPDVTFLTGGHKIGDAVRRAGKGKKYNIQVGNGVWIGSRCTLLGNISIGNSSVIAACTCVIKDVSENMLVGGVPARELKELRT